MVLGPLYAVFSDGFRHGVGPYINTIIIGFQIGSLISFLELYLFAGGLRKLRFITLFLIKTVIYVVLIVLIIFNVLVISRILKYHLNYYQVVISDEFQNYLFYKDFDLAIIYTLVFAITINFTRLMNRKMGQGVLFSFIIGNYYQPKVQERIIMFLGIPHSKDISEKIGLVKFHSFLNDFIYDITESIIIHMGIIHHYVEDEIVISWNIDKGIQNANCVRTFFHAKSRLSSLKEKYFTNYGCLPVIGASLHAGNVVRAEIGDVKSELVFHGDVMNTTARIMGKCEELMSEILISDELVKKLVLPSIYES